MKSGGACIVAVERGRRAVGRDRGMWPLEVAARRGWVGFNSQSTQRANTR